LFAAFAALDLEQNAEDVPAYLARNDQETFGSPVNKPVAAIPARDGRTVYVVLAGSNLVEVVDVSAPAWPRLVKFLPVGRNPRGLALSGDGRRAYVMNYLSRSVTILDLQALNVIAEVPVTGETLAADVLAGKILFNSAADPRLSQGGWIACASCHPHGGTDGVTWMFPDGPRQTPPLWNAAQTRPWHWSAALDEGQDVEETIQVIQHGFGLAPGADPPLLGAANAGRSPDLDALAAFLERGIRPPSPYSVTSDQYSVTSDQYSVNSGQYSVIGDPNAEDQPRGAEGRISAAADTAEGRAVFKAAGCAVCHGGPHWTASTMPGAAGTLDPDGNGVVDEVLHDVGTLNPRDVRGQAGFDPPSLLGVGLTAPYLHDGSMPTLEALLRSGHPDPLGNGNGLSDEEIAVLIRFLHAIGPDTVPITAP
jgi:YVTN family beta-propeller protein